MITSVTTTGRGSGKSRNNQPASGIPAHGGGANGSWPPFAPGHEVNLRHGARSDKYIEPLAAAFRDVLLADRPDLAGYPEAVAAWAVAEARCERYRVWHGTHGFIDAEGNVPGGANVSVYENQAQRMRERLGLDPLAEAALAKTRAEAVLTTVDLESIRARGRAAWAARQAEDAAIEAPVEDVDE
jgi:hypothetical protein